MEPLIDWTKFNFEPDYDTEEWWEATKRKVLLVRHCNRCSNKWWPPNQIGCSNCGEIDNTGWAEAKGPGTVHSFIVVTQPILAAFTNAVPYVTAVIDLDDVKTVNGVPIRLQGVLDEGEDQVGINAKVEMYFQKVSEDGKHLPRWRLSKKQPQDVWLFPGP